VPNISGLVNAVSNDVVARLAAMTPPITLTDGSILIGRQHIYEQSAANRIVFIPVRSVFGPRGMYSTSNVAGNPVPDLLRQWLQRSIATEKMMFEVHVWGVAQPTPDPEGGDFDATQVLYQTTILSCHYLAVGAVEFTALTWTDQKPGGTQLFKEGHEAVFGITFDTPVLDTSLQYVPPGTVANSTVYLVAGQGGIPAQTQVASGSNLAPANSPTLYVASTAGFLTSGPGLALVVPTSTGDALITYTGISGNTFTGCASTSAGTLVEGSTVLPAESQNGP
jgi:hypothetical protein